MICSVIWGCENPSTKCHKCGMDLCDEHEKMHVIACPYHDAHLRGTKEYDKKHGTNTEQELKCQLRD